MTDLIKQKIKTPDELAEIVIGLKKQGKKIVQCHGVFELVHPGHIYHFESAKKNGDVLVITVTADKFVNKGPGRPIFSQEVRAIALANAQIVDYVAISNDFNAVEILKKIKPDIYFKGQEYESALNDPNRNLYKEAEAIKLVGGEIRFTYEPIHSSTRFLKDYFDIYSSEVKEFLVKFGGQYESKQIINILKGLKSMKVMVIGETIIDEYHYCKGMGKVPKDNLVATKYINDETFAGGALACANHLAGFCDNVCLVTVLGGPPSEASLVSDKENNHEDFIKGKLKSNIDYKFFYNNEGRTIVKRRFIDPTFFTKMFEVYYFDDRYFPESLSNEIVSYLDGVLPEYDVVIVTDYGHGFFDKNIISKLTEKAKFLAVNTQTNSANTGFNLITKYPRVDYVCIDEPEARLAVHKKDEDIKDVMDDILRMIKIKKMIITRGHNGSVAYEDENKMYSVPVLSTRIVDRVGAGDAFLAITSPCVAKGTPMEIAGFIGNVVGAIHVTVVGNKSSIEPVSVYRFIQTLLK